MAVTATALAAQIAARAEIASFTPQNNIAGTIDIQALIEERHVDRLEVTEHPVETGAQITDHSFLRPFEVTMRCGWSNAQFASLRSIVDSFSSGSNPLLNDYVSSVYSALLALQQSRTLFTITTALRQYSDMLMTDLEVERDQKTAQALMVNATFRQVILASTVTTTLPPQTNQANPASTAETLNNGTAVPTAGTPAPGGAPGSPDWDFVE